MCVCVCVCGSLSVAGPSEQRSALDLQSHTRSMRCILELLRRRKCSSSDSNTSSNIRMVRRRVKRVATPAKLPASSHHVQLVADRVRKLTGGAFLSLNKLSRGNAAAASDIPLSEPKFKRNLAGTRWHLIRAVVTLLPVEHCASYDIGNRFEWLMRSKGSSCMLGMNVGASARIFIAPGRYAWLPSRDAPVLATVIGLLRLPPHGPHAQPPQPPQAPGPEVHTVTQTDSICPEPVKNLNPVAQKTPETKSWCMPRRSHSRSRRSRSRRSRSSRRSRHNPRQGHKPWECRSSSGLLQKPEHVVLAIVPGAAIVGVCYCSCYCCCWR